jgi:hypothetical protein
VKPKINVNVSALAAGVTSLFAVIGTLTATGAVGRLERNEPDALIAAVVIVLLGSVMLVIAGLPITTGRSEIFATLVGTGLTVIGIGWAIAAGINDASRSERPELRVSVDGEHSLLKGTVKAGNLESDQRFAVLVEGLKPATAERRKWDMATLAQYYVGPDGDGKVDLPLEVIVPSKGYTAVGVRAWSGDSKRCRTYPRRGASETFKKQVKAARAGCVVLPLPAAAESSDAKTTPATAGKRAVTLAWIGHRVSSRRVRLTVAVPGPGRRAVVLLAGRRRSGALRQLLRAVSPAGKSGAYRARFAVRVGRGFTRLCARADVVAQGARAPKRLRRCPLPRSVTIGSGGAELRRPR